METNEQKKYSTDIENCIADYYRYKFRKATDFYKTQHFSYAHGGTDYTIYYLNRKMIDRKGFKDIAKLAQDFAANRFSEKPKLWLCEFILYLVLDEVEKRVTGTVYDFKYEDTNHKGQKFHL